ncbi:endo alpha-1,4 polygalactosaminidase [Paraburkholderia heleia]|uniref:endo alpha-1,4 polygalactosaminidase n=1 Tax=Paraburkholderia heleia TaxID=634127 RepID=UPI0009FC1B22|nr:endo alpha-1,4 polygalactosaminidase [Paraburkholderia heleia]
MRKFSGRGSARVQPPASIALARNAVSRSAQLLLATLCALCAVPAARADAAAADTPAPNLRVAFYYGATPPTAQLANYDIAVIEPDSGFQPREHALPCTQWFAYASVGEITPERTYFAQLPRAWLMGRNANWASRVVDQNRPGWPAFFVRHVIDPLWARGYRGFFLDTLDSYQLVTSTDAGRERQREGIVRVIRAIKASHPAAKLILNRGFELLPQIHDDVSAVAFESLYGGWDQANARYVAVPEADRNWLLAMANNVKAQYGLPVISIDYCATADTECARKTAASIAAHGIVPFVTDGSLQSLPDTAAVPREGSACPSVSRD